MNTIQTINRRSVLAGTGAAVCAIPFATGASAALVKSSSIEEPVSIEAARNLWRRYQHNLILWSEAYDSIGQIRTKARKKHAPYDDTLAVVRVDGPSGVYLYRRETHGHDPHIRALEQSEKLFPAPVEAGRSCHEIRRAILKRENQKIRRRFRAECRRLGIANASRKVRRYNARMDAATDAIRELPGTDPVTLLLKMAWWRDMQCDCAGEINHMSIESPDVQMLDSAYEALVAETGFDPNREAVAWRKEWRAAI